MKIQIKNTSGDVLFEYDKENNTIKDTVVKALEEGVNLSYANLYGVDLSYADLSGANLRYANLYEANLNHADLNNADLSGANLYEANLNHADLNNADLYFADLSYAHLRNADFDDANLNHADLNHADLSGVKLYGADLVGANLRNANLSGVDLVGAKNIPHIPFACPSEGSFIAWKKIQNYEGEYIVKLLIPEDAKRSSATTNKCRCDKAKVLEIRNINNDSTVDVITNGLWTNCVYKVGKYVYPDSFDENRWNECSNGIHFFVDKQEAIDY